MARDHRHDSSFRQQIDQLDTEYGEWLESFGESFPEPTTEELEASERQARAEGFAGF